MQSVEHLLSSVVVTILCSLYSILYLFWETVRTWSLFRQRRTGNGRHAPAVLVVCCSRPTVLDSQREMFEGTLRWIPWRERRTALDFSE